MGLISYLTTIRFEAGASREIRQDLAELGLARPLIVTDRGVVAAGLVERMSASAPALRAAPVFQEVPTNPTEAAASGALDTYRQHGCDGIVAIGGGSPLDLAKAVALLTTHEGPLSPYAAILGGLPKITARVAPVIAVPTTAGTGSEVGRAALITLNDGRSAAPSYGGHRDGRRYPLHRDLPLAPR
jgi:4-hydroxybutyrate dehydrogenase